jgi:glycosyltransferase involved in cell wall biosynthesis
MVVSHRCKVGGVMENGQLNILVLVATCDRPELLRNRCLPSIYDQSIRPSKILVVDDSRLEENRLHNQRIINEHKSSGKSVELLLNVRTPGACGAWNSGIEHILGKGFHPDNTFIAILDDDDSWGEKYLELCTNEVIAKQLDMVACGINRIIALDEPVIIQPAPSKISADEFLVRNPGIQGSNLFLRMKTLLMAGCFDESLISSTDRDLCIRIADLNSVKYQALPVCNVSHYAEPNRARLSKRMSATKMAGLTLFWEKYRTRMNKEQRRQFLNNANRYFGWKPKTLSNVSQFENAVTSPVLHLAKNSKLDDFSLIVGTISTEPETVFNLLKSFQSNQIDADFLLLDNGSPVEKINTLKQRCKDNEINLVIIPVERQKIDAADGWFGDSYIHRPTHQVGIAQARTMLQRYLGLAMNERKNAIGWILDDDMALDFRAKTYISWLPILRNEGIDVLFGAYEGSSPNPPMNGFRVQLVDLVHNLDWLTKIDSTQLMPSRVDENYKKRRFSPDYYYDLSRKHTNHLEDPHWLEPVTTNETIEDALIRLLQGANHLSSGHPTTRKLEVNISTDPIQDYRDSVNRGGITFILNSDALNLTPNLTLNVAGMEARRSDMIWAILNKNYRGLVTTSIAFPVQHISRPSTKTDMNGPKLVAEFIGSSLYSALTDFLSDKENHNLTFSRHDLIEIESLIHQNLEKRLIRMDMNMHRIDGIALNLLTRFPNFSGLDSLRLQLRSKLNLKEWKKVRMLIKQYSITDCLIFLSELHNIADNYAKFYRDRRFKI